MKHTCPSGVQHKHLGDGYAITLDRVDAEYMTFIARKGRVGPEIPGLSEDQFPDCSIYVKVAFRARDYREFDVLRDCKNGIELDDVTARLSDGDFLTMKDLYLPGLSSEFFKPDRTMQELC